MYVNIAVLKETQPHDRRVAMSPAIVPKLVRLGAKLRLQCGAGTASNAPDAAFQDVALVEYRSALARAADVVLAVRPPPSDVVEAMTEGAILISFIYANKKPQLVSQLLKRKITRCSTPITATWRTATPLPCFRR